MTTTNDRPIGVFDSGVGGLTVMRALVDEMPDEQVVYLGDTARVPYGNRTAETVRRYALNATRLLIDRGIKALVVACNTASAYGLRALVDACEIPVVGVIDPVARRAAERTETGHIGVLGTRGTVRSECYPDALARHAPASTVHQQASPLLVPLAEEGWLEGTVVDEVADHYLAELAGPPIDTIILGCTHYPILRPALQRITDELFDHDVELLDSATATAEAAAAVLTERSRRRSPTGPVEEPERGELDFLFTDVSPAFVETAERFFDDRPDQFTHVDITDAAPE